MLHNRVLHQLLMGRIIILRIFKDPQGETGNPCGVEGEEAGVAEAGARAESRKEILLNRRIQDIH